MHEPTLDFSTHTLEEAEWFYLKNDKGVITANEITMTHLKRCHDPNFWQTDLKGTIDISTDAVTFSLQIPIYYGPDGKGSNAPLGYREWQNNGTYTLIRGSAPELKSYPSDYRPNSCDEPYRGSY